MSVRSHITTQTERIVALKFTESLRDEPPGARLRALAEATVGDRDRDWFGAYQEEERQRTRYVAATRAARAEVEAMMVVARRFFRGVYDREGHSVPRILAACLNGSTPSDLERWGTAERVRALRSLLVTIRGYPELHYDAGVLGELTVAVQQAEQALHRLDRARRGWRESVNRKQATAAEFDASYKGLVSAAKAIGFRDELPAFVEQDGADEEDADPNTVPPEEMAGEPTEEDGEE